MSSLVTTAEARTHRLLGDWTDQRPATTCAVVITCKGVRGVDRRQGIYTTNCRITQSSWGKVTRTAEKLLHLLQFTSTQFFPYFVFMHKLIFPRIADGFPDQSFLLKRIQMRLCLFLSRCGDGSRPGISQRKLCGSEPHITQHISTLGPDHQHPVTSAVAGLIKLSASVVEREH